MPRVATIDRVASSTRIHRDSIEALHLPNLIACFQANPADPTKRTDVAAAVASPNDISTASWATTGTSARTATTFTEDTSTGHHNVQTTSGVPGLQTNHLFTVTVKYQTTRAWARVNVGGLLCYVKTADATIGTKTFTTASATKDGSTITVTATGTAPDTYLILTTATADNTPSFAGSGTDTFTVVDAHIVISQTNVSALGSIAGSAGAVSLAQATPANRPQLLYTNGTLYSPVPVAGYRAVLCGDGVNDCLAAAFAGLTQPYTVLARANLTALVTTRPVVSDVTDLDGAIYFRPASSAMALYAGTAMPSAYSPTGNVSLAGVFNGAASSVWANGVQSGSTGNAGTNSASGISLFGTATQGHMVGYIDEIAIVAGALDANGIGAYHSRCAAIYP